MEIIIKKSLKDKIISYLNDNAFKFFLFLAWVVSRYINVTCNCNNEYEYQSSFAEKFSTKVLLPLVEHFDALDYDDRGYRDFYEYGFDVVYNGSFDVN